MRRLNKDYTEELMFIKRAYAHCDIPCGIYETDTMKHSAATCLRMVEKINSLDGAKTIEDQASLVRMVQIKEKHAQKVKDEIFILWADYYKPEHIEKFPELHESVWMTAKQASRVKQHVSEEDCRQLIDMVHKIDKIFVDSK